MEELKLRPCPFCGLTATIVYDNNITVECEYCTGAVGYFLSKEAAIKAWNTRAKE